MESTAVVNSSSEELIDFMSLEEASQQLNMSYSSLTKWLNTNKELKAKYCFKAKYQGRKRTLIYIDALPIILNVKDTGRNVSEEKKELNAQIPKVKEQIATEAVQQSKSVASYMQDPIIAMRVEQLQQREDINELKAWKDSISEDLDIKPLDAQQRKFMNSKIRGLGFALEVDISRVWAKLHKTMNKANLNDYKFLDYKPAMDYLKEWYKAYNVDWEADDLIQLND